MDELAVPLQKQRTFMWPPCEVVDCPAPSRRLVIPATRVAAGDAYEGFCGRLSRRRAAGGEAMTAWCRFSSPCLLSRAGREAPDTARTACACQYPFLERADVAVQLGHTDGGALVMSTYGHPSEDLARERLKRAYATNVVRLPVGEAGLQEGSTGS
jgi:hypothetical protein